MKSLLYIFALVLLVSCQSPSSSQTGLLKIQNPIIPGYFADPSVVELDGTYYLYATADPWGGDFLGCWESSDFIHWTFHKLNWPTKSACTSSNSNSNMVWAPSVIRKGNHYYMYISVGSEIWCGKADHPLGPWENMLDNQPLIPFDTTLYSHEIDAEIFIDDDGRNFLYWGSGWNWINGRCFVAELNNDMHTFISEKVEVTPERYFEAPWMIKRNDVYYLTYSEGKTIEDTYEVRYATGTSPFGPFKQAENSPILTKNDELEVYGPAHHTIVEIRGQHYILYHKHRLPFVSGTAFRQISMNEMHFDDEIAQILNIVPEHTVSFPVLNTTQRQYIKPLSMKASSERADFTKAANAMDFHFGTLWEAAPEDMMPELITQFSRLTTVENIELRLEYPWKQYFFKVEVSKDGNTWKLVADFTDNGISGSPVNIPVNSKARYVRLTFNMMRQDTPAAVWELFYQ